MTELSSVAQTINALIDARKRTYRFSTGIFYPGKNNRPDFVCFPFLVLCNAVPLRFLNGDGYYAWHLTSRLAVARYGPLFAGPPHA